MICIFKKFSESDDQMFFFVFFGKSKCNYIRQIYVRDRSLQEARLEKEMFARMVSLIPGLD